MNVAMWVMNRVIVGQELQLVPSEQLAVFLWSLALGAVLGVVYDVLRILRLGVGHHPAAVFVEDVLFWFSTGICGQLFLYYVDRGFFRLFLLTGMGIGFVVYHFTAGRAVMAAAEKVLGFLGALHRLLRDKLLQPLVSRGRRIAKRLCKNRKVGKKLEQQREESGKKEGKDDGKSENPLAK